MPGPEGFSGHPLQPLEATLAEMPAYVQERWFARLWLVKPVILACLSMFWLASGIVGLIRQHEAADILVSHGVPANAADISVLVGSAVDILVGAAALVRPLARRALLAMIAITLFYLAASTLLVPDLWLAAGTAGQDNPSALSGAGGASGSRRAMSLWADILRWVHVIGAAVLFGTGAGIAFFMLMAQRTARADLVAHVAGTVVIADTIFTATAVVVQPITGCCWHGPRDGHCPRAGSCCLCCFMS